MYTNSSITIYNKYYDKVTRLDKYKRTIIEDVFWDEKQASNRLQSGLESADSVFVLLPFDSLLKANYIAPMEFDGSEGTFTIKIGDRIIKDDIFHDITSRPTDLDKLFQTYTVTSVDIKDFGSNHMRHIEVGAK